MWRYRFRSLRLRLAVLTAAVVLTSAAAAGVLSWTLSIADGQVSELSSAQRRLEDLSTASSRVGDYALAALQTTESNELQTDRLSLPRKGIQEAFERFKSDVAEEVLRRGHDSATIESSRGRALAFLRASFDVLDRQVMEAIREGRGGDEPTRQRAEDKVRASLNMFAGSFGPALSQAIESERIAARNADDAMADLRQRLTQISMVGIIFVVLVSLMLYKWIVSPLLGRVSEVAGAAADIARGRTDIRLAVRGHDELSLLMMRFNRMALSLSRRERRLLNAQSRLQEIVDARTVELRGANERLSDVDKARRRFFTDVSHELRTPLTVILGEADVTLRGKPRAEDLSSALSTIRARARRLHRRVEDLLRVARSESGQLDLEFEPVSVAEIMAQAQEGVGPVAKTHNVEIVAGSFDDPIVEGDAEWLRQVVEGIVANAVRHSPGGGAIRLGVSSVGTSAMLTVEDDGEGIPAKDLPHVFERFYRGVSEKEGSGFGIGLALAKWVVERHGGTIDVKSQTAALGRRSGTKITISLPAMSARLAIGAAGS